MQIWKFPLPTPENRIEMPRRAKLLTVQMQDGVPMLWALVDPAAMSTMRIIAVAGTGWELEPRTFGDYVYIGTFQSGPMVWHVFDLGEV